MRRLLPLGLLAFCAQESQNCTYERDSAKLGSIASTPNDRDLQRVNRFVNSAIEPASNGEASRWSVSYLDERRIGDCEDYALEKQKLLEAAGWPRRLLRLAVVAPAGGLEAHAVLVVSTEEGDVVLDNLRSDIRNWRDTGYVFFKRQSATDDLTWYSAE